MTKPGAVALSLALSLGLAIGTIVRADRDAGAPATQPSGASPEDVFKDRGLTRMGFLLIVPNETEVHDGARALRVAKGKMASAALARRQAEATIKSANDSISAMEAQYEALNNQYATVVANGANINKSNVNQYNAWNDQKNLLIIRLNTLRQNITLQKTQLDAMEKAGAAGGDAGMTFINLAMDLGGKAEAVAAAYTLLAKDTELAAAIDQYNKVPHSHAKLGPSGLFLEDLPYIRQCVKEAASSAVPLIHSEDDTEPRVRVVINGKVTDTMIWDSGATVVQISDETARKLELPLTNKDPGIQITVADGRKVKAKLVMLDSIRLGAYTVKNIECVVLPPKNKSEDLLGGTFQKHFVAQLDQNAGQLQLSPNDAGVTVGPVVEALHAPQTKPAN
jgi:clan AA aspartic protease (TIGR02281 family)